MADRKVIPAGAGIREGRGRRRGAHPYRRFWRWALGLGCGLLLLAALQAALFWYDHLELLRELSASFRTRLLIFTGILAVSTLAVFLLALRYFFQAYVAPAHRLEEDLEALTVGAPQARVRGADAEGLSALASVLNRLMERYEASEAGLEKRVAAATVSLADERREVETILDALSEGVLVCDAEGVVQRYNRAARRLLAPSHEPGVGRSVYCIVARQLCDYALETIAGQLTTGITDPFVQFRAERPGAEPLQGRIAPLNAGGGAIRGFVLTLQETAPPLSTTRLVDARPSRSELDPEKALLKDLRFVVFDTETTGMNPSRGDEIISIGAVVVARGRIVAGEVFETLVDPGVPVSAASTKVHGLTDSDLAQQPRIAEALAAFARFTEDAVLVAHNASFDVEFLRQKEAATGVALRQPVLCTLVLSAILHPVQASHSLDTLLGRYGIRRSGRHTALGDAAMTAELFLRLLPQLETRGITTLAQAVRASRDNPLSRLNY